VETVPDSNPQYIDEVEALLRTNFFYDDARTSVLYEEPNAFSEEEIGSRKSIYIQTLRVLAGARQDERLAAAAQDPSMDVKTWNQNWQLTSRKLGALSLQHRQELVPLSRRLSLINNAERALEEGYAHRGLFDHQIPYLQGIVENIQREPAPIILPSWWEGERNLRLPGITVTGPTGIGKSAILARAVTALGVDKPLISFEGERQVKSPAHVLVVEPSQGLIRQMLGRAGKDTFRRLAPDVTVGGYFQHEQTTDANVIFISIPMFIRNFRDGYLRDTPIDTIFVDEDHHLTEEKFLTTLLTHWNGPTFGFSATPTYGHEKDVRNILRYEVKEGEITDYADGKILSSLQLYNTIVLPEDVGIEHDISALPAAERRALRQHAMSVSARDFLIPLLAEGRKGIIFCEPGEESKHAQDTAALLDGLELPDGRLVKAKAIGTFQGKGDSKENEAIIKEYDEGSIDVITTTLMGQEGLDFDEVNFVCVLGKITSILKLTQMGGRGTRPSNLFDPTVLAQFNTLGFGQNPYYAKTFAEILNGGEIDQGVVITKNRTRKHSDRENSAQPDASTIEKFPEHIQRMLERVNHKNVHDVYIGRQEAGPVTEGYLPLEEIIVGKNITAREAWLRLYRAGYRFEGRSRRSEERNTSEYFFEPTAATYFSADPQPPEDGVLQIKLRGWIDTTDENTVYTLDSLADALRVNKKVLARDLLTDEESAQGPVTRTSDHKRRVWSKQDGDRIIERLREVLEFPPDRLPVVAATKRLNARYETVLEYVRRCRDELGVVDTTRGNKTLPGLPWSAVAKLEEKYGLRPDAEPIDYGRMPATPTDDDERIQYARQIQRLYLHPSWLPSIPEKPAPPAVGKPVSLPPIQTDDSATHPKPDVPPTPVKPIDETPQLKPVPQIPSFSDAKRQEEIIEVALTKVDSFTKRLSPSTKLEKKTAEKVEDDVTPTLSDAPEQAAVTAATPPPPTSPGVLPPKTDTDAVAEAMQAAKQSRAPIAEKSTLGEHPISRKLTTEERRAMVVAARGKPVADKNKTKPPAPKVAAVRGTMRQINRADMPQNYTDIAKYLADQNIACSPRIMQKLIKKGKLTSVADESGSLWGPEETALELEEVITRRIPVAEPGMRTPEEIAEQFAGLGIASPHIAHVASRVVSSTEGHIFLRREPPKEGKPAQLDDYFSPRLTQLVTSRINELLRQDERLRTKRHLNSILRFGPV